MRIVRLSVCCLALAAGAAYAATLNVADRNFMSTAARTDMTEAHEGQMAEKEGMRKEVKDLAKAMIQDHTESYEHLTELAAKTGVSIPKAISGKGPSIQRLMHVKGAGFDHRFAEEEVMEGRQTIALFKREAAHGQEADIKAYATKTLPVLEKDLELAEQCAKTAKRS